MRRGTILDAALNNGVPVPHQCRSGQCGSCKCRLLLGVVNHDEYLPGALSDRERAEGWILACRARPKTDVEVEFDGMIDVDTPALERRTATVARLEQLTQDIFHLVLALEGGPFHFNAGQYVQLRFGKLPPRSYSMANSSGSTDLEFFIRELPNGTVSHYVAWQLAVGDSVELEGPSGSAFLRSNTTAPILAAAGGSGLAPILAIARDAVSNQAHRPFHLYFGVRRVRDVFAQEELADLASLHPKFNTQVVISEASGDTNGYRTGLLHKAVAADFTDLSHIEVYTAGPPPMVEAIRQVAVVRGTLAENIYCDPFTSAASETEPSISGSWNSAANRARESEPAAKPVDLDASFTNYPRLNSTRTGKTKSRRVKARLARLMSEQTPVSGSEISTVVATKFKNRVLAASERETAEDIFRLLIEHWPIAVREALSAELKGCRDLPHDVALALASDVESVALPMLQCSKVLNNDDLMGVIAQGTGAKQIAIAQRHDLAARVTDALIESGNEKAVAMLVANEATELTARTITRIVTDYAHHGVVTESLMRRLHLQSNGSDASATSGGI